MENKVGEINWEICASLGFIWQVLEHLENLELGVGEEIFKAVISGEQSGGDTGVNGRGENDWRYKDCLGGIMCLIMCLNQGDGHENGKDG